MGPNMRGLILSVSAAVLLHCAHSFPQYWVDGPGSGCTQHPTQGAGDHDNVLQDSSIGISLTADDGAPATKLCPGKSYQLKVTYAGDSRRGIISASYGTFDAYTNNDDSGTYYEATTCPNRLTVQQSVDAVENGLTIPCDASGPNVIKVTSAWGKQSDFLQAQASFQLDASCAAASCQPAAVAPPVVAPPADAGENGDAGDSQGATSSQGGTCESSSLGYKCSKQLGQVKVHYSVGGAMPSNPCTGASLDANTLPLGATSNDQLLHMAVEATTQGYVALAFATAAGRMKSADAVLGWAQPGDAPFVSTYKITAMDVEDDDASAWATFQGAARQGDTLVVCFSRRLSEPNAEFSSTLSTDQDIALNWAVSESPRLKFHDAGAGGDTISLAAAKVSQAVKPAPPKQVIASPPKQVIAAPPKQVIAAPAAGAGTCESSSLGYKCSQQLADKVRVHYSIGGAMPSNPCTAASFASANTLPLGATTNDQLLHMAVEATTQGYVSLAFAQTASRMKPADAIVGWAVPGGSPFVDTYTISDMDVADDDATAWAVFQGVVRQGDKLLVCFTRRLNEPNAKTIQAISPSQGVNLNWALSDNPKLGFHKAGAGGQAVSLAAGLVAEEAPKVAPPAVTPVAPSPTASTCESSTLGYKCGQQLADNVRVHYSIGGAMPSNPCTAASFASANTLPLSGTTNDQLLHMAVEATTPGYVSLALAQTASRMMPADAIVGWAVPGGSPFVNTYTISSMKVGDDDATAWAVFQGVVRQGDKLLVCFTRRLNEPNAKTIQSISTSQGVNLNWALSDNPKLGFHKAGAGGQAVSLAAALVTEEVAPPAVAPVAPPSTDSTCESSTLGYKCSQQLADNVRVHYSVGGAMPSNPCTAASFSSANTLPLGATSSDDLLHMAVEATTQGYVSLAFAQTASRMKPADAIVGWAVPGGSPFVNTYTISEMKLGDEDAHAWAVFQGVVRQGDKLLVCFTRRLNEPNAKTIQAISTSEGVNLNWALSDNPKMGFHKAGAGGKSVSLAAGRVTTPVATPVIAPKLPVQAAPSPTPTPTPPVTPAPAPACDASTLGYTCSQQLGQVKVHYSIGGAMPINPCTGASFATGNTVALGDTPNDQLIHMAVEGTTQGYVSLSFAQTAGRMGPADAIVGWTGADGTPFVHTYAITSMRVKDDDASAWATFQGVARMGDTLVVCFSRRINEPASTVAPTLDLVQALTGRSLLQDGINLNWAMSDTPGLTFHNTGAGGESVSLDPATPSQTPTVTPVAPPEQPAPEPVPEPATEPTPAPEQPNPAPEEPTPTPEEPTPLPQKPAGPTAIPTQQPGAAVPGCDASAYGYTCSKQLGQVKVHYSLGGDMPNNPCTASSTHGRTLDLGSTSNDELIHMAVEASTEGYVSLAFAQTAGRMKPADAIVGWANPAGSPFVDTYTITDMDVADDDAHAWATFQGVARVGDSVVVCFSRRLSEPNALFSSSLVATKDMSFNWAVSSAPALKIHDRAGGATLNLATGGISEAVSRQELYIRWHGALMSAGWALLLPLGTLLPRHKWALGDRKLLGIHLWFRLHMLLQTLGVATMTAGFGLAYYYFEDPVTDVGKAHKTLGTVVFALAGLQFLAAFARPAPTHPRRPLFNWFHHWLGRITIVASWAAIYLGIYLYHTSIYAASLAVWVGPVAGAMVALVLMDITLSVVNYRRVRYAHTSLGELQLGSADVAKREGSGAGAGKLQLHITSNASSSDGSDRDRDTGESSRSVDPKAAKIGVGYDNGSQPWPAARSPRGLPLDGHPQP